MEDRGDRSLPYSIPARFHQVRLSYNQHVAGPYTIYSVKGVEPLTLPCKGSVFPLAPIPHFSLLHPRYNLAERVGFEPTEGLTLR